MTNHSEEEVYVYNFTLTLQDSSLTLHPILPLSQRIQDAASSYEDILSTNGSGLSTHLSTHRGLSWFVPPHELPLPTPPSRLVQHRRSHGAAALRVDCHRLVGGDHRIRRALLAQTIELT